MLGQFYGQLGDELLWIYLPVPSLNPLNLSAPEKHTCAILDNGSASVGDIIIWTIGDNSTPIRSILLLLTGWSAELSALEKPHLRVLDNSAKCWGDN